MRHFTCEVARIGDCVYPLFPCTIPNEVRGKTETSSRDELNTERSCVVAVDAGGLELTFFGPSRRSNQFELVENIRNGARLRVDASFQRAYSCVEHAQSLLHRKFPHVGVAELAPPRLTWLGAMSSGFGRCADQWQRPTTTLETVSVIDPADVKCKL